LLALVQVAVVVGTVTAVLVRLGLMEPQVVEVVAGMVAVTVIALVQAVAVAVLVVLLFQTEQTLQETLQLELPIFLNQEMEAKVVLAVLEFLDTQALLMVTPLLVQV
jgi:hypothetical protein